MQGTGDDFSFSLSMFFSMLATTLRVPSKSTVSPLAVSLWVSRARRGALGVPVFHGLTMPQSVAVVKPVNIVSTTRFELALHPSVVRHAFARALELGAAARIVVPRVVAHRGWFLRGCFKRVHKVCLTCGLAQGQANVVQ